jgi:soluble lytic murein transglycosylase
MQSALPAPWEGLRRQMLTGKCLLARGQAAPAEGIFRQGSEQDKRMSNLWRALLAEALMEQGKGAEALATLRETLAGTPVPRARIRALLAGRAAKDNGSEAEYGYLSAYLSGAVLTSDDYDLLARLYELAKARRDAPLLQRLPAYLWRQPKDDATARQWSSLPPGDGPRAAGDLLARVQRLSDLRLTRLLAEELESSNVPPLDPETARKLGRLYFSALLRDRNYRQAAARIQSDVMRRRFAFDERESLATAIRVEIRRQVIAPALKWLSQLDALDPKPESLPGLYLDLARYYEQQRELASMVLWCRRIIEEHGRSSSAPAAYWMLVWNSYRAGDFERAVIWSRRGIERGESFPPDGLARLTYWQARAQEHLGQKEQAAATRATLRARWPSSFYGLVLEPGAISAPVPAKYSDARVAAPQNPPDVTSAWQVPELADAMFAYAVGEDDLADELMRQALLLNLPAPAIQQLAHWLHFVQQHYLQQRLIANRAPGEHVRQAVADSAFWRQAYPPAYWALVRDEAGAQEVSPHFVLAIMREESRFQSNADSRSGAKGLMQLMPATAKDLARRERVSVTEEALFNPELNIPLGVRYLRQVLHRFDWNPIYGAAAYNAGPGALSRWLRTWRGLPLDEFIETIPYEETQNYVRRVYASYLIYRKLYP